MIARITQTYSTISGFNPLPWMTFSVNSQLPAFAKGFTEVDTYATVQPLANLQAEFWAPVSEWEPVLPG